MGPGADINGLTHVPSMPYMKFTVFGDVLQNVTSRDGIMALDCLMSLAAKHRKIPQLVVMPALSSSALHVAVGQIWVLEKEKAVRTYSILLETFSFNLVAPSFKDCRSRAFLIIYVARDWIRKEQVSLETSSYTAG